MLGFSDTELLASWRQLVAPLGPQFQGSLQIKQYSLTYTDPSGLTLDMDFLNNRELYGRIPIGKNELLAKAIGLKNQVTKVLDATAGLGSDSLFLARMGVAVLAIERNPVIYFLLKNSQARALGYTPQTRTEQETLEALQRIEFCQGDLIQAVPPQVTSFAAQVAYVDPMYPHTSKTALPRKEMVVFRSFVGPDEDSQELQQKCLGLVTQRVVVKRPLKGEFLGAKPQHSFAGKTVRYDMYLVK